jgi:succinate dehydrogenase / fumarate reductase membrane anchor subunit
MSNNNVSMRSDLARVRRLGPAHDGVGHWWAQRLTALALVPLILWFVASIASLAGADHATVADWIAQPIPAMLLVLLVVATFHHAQLGLQVVIEDYVHGATAKTVSLFAANAGMAVLGLSSVLAVLRLSFGA